ncbi:hypothetical protein LSAT2_005402 [Lamellibrachia satsuma]|nr:hypothetical protein LSAT2_005402 [Lamellibrachia satsuma]
MNHQDPNKHMCACGETRSCASRDLKCNCDVNDDVTRVDDGYITEKTDLPIRSVHIRKSGATHGDVALTISSLSCWGKAPDDEDPIYIADSRTTIKH